MLESCRLEQSSSAAGPVLGCRVLCHSGEPLPRMSPSLLDTGLARTEGSISSGPPGDRIRSLGQAVLLDPVSHPSLLHEDTEDTSAPASITSPVSAPQPQHAGQHQGWVTPTHPAPALLHGGLLLSSLQSAFFATGISKASFIKIPEMANRIWKNQGSFYKLMIVNARAGEHQLPPWCHQPRNESSGGHPATDKRQHHELAFPTWSKSNSLIASMDVNRFSVALLCPLPCPQLSTAL